MQGRKVGVMQTGTKRLSRETRILLLMPGYEMGGAETQFRYFIAYAEEKGWKLDVIIEQRFGQDSELLRKDMAQMKHVRFYPLHEYGMDRGRMLLHIFRQVLRNMLQVNYKSLLIYNPVYLSLVPPMKFLGMRVIYSERVSASDIAGNVCFQRYLRLCDHVFANSEYGQGVLEGITGKRVGLIRNGRPIVGQLPVRESRNVLRILMPGRIKPHKNQMLLLRFLRDYPDFSGKVIFAGVTEDREYGRKLKNFVSRYQLGGRTEFLGYVENMRDEYEKADLVILPSYMEGTPNVVLEAYAYGRPVIVSDIETERYIVRNPNLRFGLKGTDGIRQCITYIENLPDREYGDLLRKNRKYVVKNYAIPRMAEKIYEVLG